MSQTATPAPTLSIVQKLEQYGHEALTAVDHAAIRLVGFCATTEQSLANLTAESPILKLVWDAGVASATAHGIPVMAIENVFSQVLAAAQAFATDGLSQTAPIATADPVAAPSVGGAAQPTT
jgi:hypothetical protein